MASINTGFVESEDSSKKVIEVPTVMVMEASDEPKSNIQKSSEMLYELEDVPPWYMALLLGLQHYLTMFGSTVTVPLLLTPALCIEEEDPVRGHIISTMFFVSGLVTLLQALLGIRLPIVQGGTFSFLAPTFAILSLERNACPANFENDGWGNGLSDHEKREEWQRRMREIQGCIIVASIGQTLIGFTGIVGRVLKYISPLTIAPAIAMVGLALFPAASAFASKNWIISMTTVALVVLCSQYLREVSVPFLCVRDGKLSTTRVFFFKLFPVLLAILVAWALCGVLTFLNLLPEGNAGRTDLKAGHLLQSEWFRVPYPLQWGWPTVSLAGSIGMLTGVLASAVESIGDYYACARLCGARPPPTHAINRAIGIEGLGCILAGVMGTGNGTTSYSENVGAIGVTKVGSRVVIVYGAFFMIGCGIFAKFGAVFLTIPDPVVGGVFCVMFSVITAVGLSNLQFVDLNSTRNLLILGAAIFFSLMISTWVEGNKAAIATGFDFVDQILLVLLKTSMFVAGLIGFVLDNTIPGTDEERGLIAWQRQSEDHDSENSTESSYDLPLVTPFLRRCSWTRHVPFLPTYKA